MINMMTYHLLDMVIFQFGTLNYQRVNLAKDVVKRLNQQQVGCIIKFHQQECRFDNYLKLMAKSHQNNWGYDHGHFVRTSEVLNCWCILWVDHEMAVGHFTLVPRLSIYSWYSWMFITPPNPF